METQEEYQYINQGYSLALFIPDEFKAALKTKMLELAKTGKDKKRWLAMSKGFDVVEQERALKRKQELEQSKNRGKGKSQGRSR